MIDDIDVMFCCYLLLFNVFFYVLNIRRY